MGWPLEYLERLINEQVGNLERLGQELSQGVMHWEGDEEDAAEPDKAEDAEKEEEEKEPDLINLASDSDDSWSAGEGKKAEKKGATADDPDPEWMPASTWSSLSSLSISEYSSWIADWE